MRQIIFKAALVLSLFSVFGGEAFAQKINKDYLSVSVYGRESHMLNALNIYNILDSYDYPIVGATVGLNTKPEDGNWWEWAYNFPHYGLGFSYAAMSTLKFSTPGQKPLGDIYNFYGWAQFDIIKTKRFAFGPMAEFGPAYAPKKFEFDSNTANRYVGSHVLVFIGVGLEARFMITPQWEIGAQSFIFHHSNGMMGVPNWGLNELGSTLYLRYHLAEPYMDRRKNVEKPQKPEFDKGFHFDVYASGAMHSCDAEFQVWKSNKVDPSKKPDHFKKWGRAVLGVDMTYRYHPIFSTGIGADLFYTSNTKTLEECDRLLHGRTRENRHYCPFYGGVYLLQEIFYKNFALQIGVGAYVYKNLGYEEDRGWMYQRVGFRYYLPKRIGGMFLGFDVRAHKFNESDCLEFTLGKRF